MGVAWDDEVTDWPGSPPLDGDVGADACVIGLGGSGLAAVEALRSRGLSVIGLDAGRVAAGAAGRNGGFLIGGPALFLHDAIARWGPSAVDLYRATLDELAALAQRVPVRRVGSIRLARSDEELVDCAAHESALREHGIAVTRYDGPLGQGIFLPDDAAVNPALRAVTLAAALPGLHEHTRVTSVSAGRVVTDHGVVSAPVVIVAVDGRLAELVPSLHGRVRTARLQMLATAPVAPRLPCPVYARWGYDYAQQDARGVILAGGGRDVFADAEWTADAEPTAPVQDYIEQFVRTLTDEPVHITHRWAASVGFTPDARPLCTVVDEGAAGRVVAVGGYNGTGNLVGPVAARAAVALAVDGTPPPPYLAA